MKIAIIGDCDTFLFRGQDRPPDLGPYKLSPLLNLARGFRELGVTDVHYLVCTPEVQRPTVEDGPLGPLHRLPQPPLSGTGTFHLWRRKLLLDELRRIQPALVHGQGTEREYALTAVTSPYPHVITFHGIMHRVHEVSPPPLISLEHVARWSEKYVLRKAREVVCITNEVRQFTERRAPHARCHLAPNAIAPCFFEVQPVGRATSEFQVLYVGTIGRRKGLVYLLEAIALAEQQLARRIRLRVIGAGCGGRDSGYLAQAQARARELGLAERVDWLGNRAERGVAAELAATDLLALPSFWESFGMCLAEAMAAGVPVVATNITGIPDVVEHGRQGLLVPPGDAPALGGALAELLGDPARRAVMSAAARRKAAAYSPRAVAEQTLAVYQAVLEGAGAPSSPRKRG